MQPKKLALVHPPAEKAPRPRDLLWDFTAYYWFGGTKENGFDVPAPQRARCGRIVRDLKAYGATPEDLAKRILRYFQRFPDCECSPEAMVKWWPQLAEDDPGQDRLKRQAQRALAALREQAEEDERVGAENRARQQAAEQLGGTA